MAKVERLREAALLSVAQMALLVGVSRVTYYGWVRGGNIRTKNLTRLNRVVKALLSRMKAGLYPTDEHARMVSEKRFEALLEILRQRA